MLFSHCEGKKHNKKITCARYHICKKLKSIDEWLSKNLPLKIGKILCALLASHEDKQKKITCAHRHFVKLSTAFQMLNSETCFHCAKHHLSRLSYRLYI